jgi:hypothetical protein
MASLPKVAKCDITECAYNHEKMCHASAITVGNGLHPRCETFFSRSQKGGDIGAIGKVGACKSANCEYNQNLECQAPEINVGCQGSEVDCLTFEARTEVEV